jgi:hypothetical protein
MMHHRLRMLTVALFLLTVTMIKVAPASAGQPSDAARIASLQYLVGTWSCSFQTADGKVRALSQTIAPNGGGWLHGRATSGTYRQDVYIEYDARNSQFVYIVLDAGGYQVLVSNSLKLNRSTWHDAYPPAEGHGVFTEVSPTEYTIVSTWTQNGAPVSTRDTCNKQ